MDEKTLYIHHEVIFKIASTMASGYGDAADKAFWRFLSSSLEGALVR
jgi:hypothetical protein